jgi:CBS domain-containing protein
MVRHKPLLALTAEDLMSRDVVRLPEEMPLRDAARLMLDNQISGAPVINGWGRCVGILSSMDFLRQAVTQARTAEPPLTARPMTCAFQVKRKDSSGEDIVVCTLPLGVCPLQAAKYLGPDGKHAIICTEPHCVLADWQMVDLETLPTDAVRQYMTADPVTVGLDTPIRVLARHMIDAHIHRVVVDAAGKPVGIVSSTDILAAVAYADDDPVGGHE